MTSLEAAHRLTLFLHASTFLLTFANPLYAAQMPVVYQSVVFMVDDDDVQWTLVVVSAIDTNAVMIHRK